MLWRLLKQEGKRPEQVAKLLDLIDKDDLYRLSFLEKRYKWLKDEIGRLEMQKDKNYLHEVNNESASAKYTLDYCRDTEQRLREELQRLHEEKSKIDLF